MRRFLPLLAVTLFALFAAQPLFVPQLTCSDDSPFGLNKAVLLEHAIRNGHLFPRWLPEMAHGYGYPHFNFYAPLVSYLLIAVHALGFSYPAAFHIVLGLSIWLAGVATYAFVREWWGEPAGVAAAVVYLTAPYFAYDTLFRGALAESFALAWPPLILFTLHRALTTRLPNKNELGISPMFGGLCLDFGIWDFISSLSFAALLYTHNATSLGAAPLFAGYIALLALLQRNWRTLLHGSLILLLGLALAAYFWLPALVESSLVQTDRLLVPPIFTYYTNYLSLGELFAPSIPIDPLLINPSPAKALGLLAALLAVLGFAAIVFKKSQVPKSQVSIRHWKLGWFDFAHHKFGSWDFWLLGFGIFIFISLLSYAFLTLSVSHAVWDHLPLIKFIQFPWRFLSLAALCAAILAGAAAAWSTKHAWATASIIALVAALGHLSWWYPRYCVPFREIDIAQTLQYEFATATLGATAKGEFLPRTARFVPADDSLAQALIRGEQPQYLTGLPTDASLTVTDPDPLDYQAALTLSQPAQLTFNQFYFPGWQAALDNQPARLTPAPDTGLILIDVPAGAHQLHFYFGSTPIRTTAGLISLLAVIAIITYCVLRITYHVSPISNLQSPIFNLRSPITHYSLLITLPLALLLLRPLLIDRTFNPLRHSAFDGQTLNLGQPLDAQLAGGLTLLSTEFPPTVASGSDFDVSLYLTPRERTANAYRPRFDVISADGLTWNNGNEALPPRWHREPPETPYWPVGQYAQWTRRETILPGAPPGAYRLTATIFDRATLAPDSLVDENGNFTAPVAALGELQVTRPAAPPQLTELNIQYPTVQDFGPLTLLGYNLDRSEARPGDSVLITLFLRADEKMNADLQFNLLNPDYPTSQWLPGDIWRFQVIQRIPAEAASGPFRFAFRLADSEFQAFNLTPIQLTAPERLFTAPAIAYPTAIRFGDSIELFGYNIENTTGSLNLTLAWRALATPDSDLIAFVHVEDATGRIVAQSDAVPANWSRPTPGWLAGEYILDSRALPTLVSGDYTIYVGLADRLTGSRLPTAAGDRARLGVYKAP